MWDDTTNQIRKRLFEMERNENLSNYKRIILIRSIYLKLLKQSDFIYDFIKNKHKKKFIIITYFKAKELRKQFNRPPNDLYGHSFSYLSMTIKNLKKWEKLIYEIILEEKIKYYTCMPSFLPYELKNHITKYLITPNVLNCIGDLY